VKEIPSPPSGGVSFFRHKKTGALGQRRFWQENEETFIDTSSPEGKEEKPAGMMIVLTRSGRSPVDNGSIGWKP